MLTWHKAIFLVVVEYELLESVCIFIIFIKRFDKIVGTYSQQKYFTQIKMYLCHICVIMSK